VSFFGSKKFRKQLFFSFHLSEALWHVLFPPLYFMKKGKNHFYLANNYFGENNNFVFFFTKSFEFFKKLTFCFFCFCFRMKPAWDQLMEQYSANSEILVGDVDCIGDGKKLCDDIGVQGFPTIKVHFSQKRFFFVLKNH
jgi:hypothetical protein